MCMVTAATNVAELHRKSYSCGPGPTACGRPARGISQSGTWHPTDPIYDFTNYHAWYQTPHAWRELLDGALLAISAHRFIGSFGHKTP